MWCDRHGAGNIAAVRELIDRESPDLISLVEVDEPWGRPSTLQALAESTGYRWAFVPAFEYRQEGGFGNAVLSRLRIDAVQQWQLLPPSLYDGTEQSEPRTALLCNVNADGHRLWFGSTHLPRRDPNMRAQAATRLLSLLDGLVPPWIVCGDFNQPPGQWLPEHVATTPSPATPTYPLPEPSEAIDYCLLNEVHATAAVPESTASDHLPVLVDAKVANTIT